MTAENTLTVAAATLIANQITSTLTKQDRCDQCSAAATTAVVLLSGAGELLFCTHHLKKNRDALEGKCVWVEVLVDNRGE